MNTITPWYTMLAKMFVMARWNVAGAFDSPMGMRTNSYSPSGVANAVFSMSHSRILN